MAVLKRVCEEAPRPIGEINPEVLGWLSEIIAKLHAKKPDELIPVGERCSDHEGAAAPGLTV